MDCHSPSYFIEHVYIFVLLNCQWRVGNPCVEQLASVKQSETGFDLEIIRVIPSAAPSDTQSQLAPVRPPHFHHTTALCEENVFLQRVQDHSEDERGEAPREGDH